MFDIIIIPIKRLTKESDDTERSRTCQLFFEVFFISRRKGVQYAGLCSTKARLYCHRPEVVLPELLSLQHELVMATPWDDATDVNDLKLYAVVNRLAELNAQCNGAADMELDYFIDGADRVCKEITKLARGGSGKAKVMNALHDLCCPRRILRNITMGDESEHTEIDALVITEKAYFIIEIKNTRRDIYIDPMGNYFRCSLEYNWDSQIAEKMHTREYFLRKALHAVGEHNPKVVNVVVFTEDIQVNNRCRKLKTCSLNTLVSLIENYSGCDLYSQSDIHHIPHTRLR